LWCKEVQELDLETLYQISLEESGIARHDMVRDYVRDLVSSIGYNVYPEVHDFEGPDLVGDIPIEIKAWRSECPSYQEWRYWKRLARDRIVSRFKDIKYGLCINLLETPVHIRDDLRSKGIVSIFLSVSDTIKTHIQKIRSAIMQYFSFKNNNSECLHSIIGYRDYNDINIEFNSNFYDQAVINHLLEDKTGIIEYERELEDYNQIVSTFNFPHENLG